METRPINAVSYVPQAPARVEAAPVRAAVATDLAPPQAVAAQVGAEQTRWQRASSGETPDTRKGRSSVVTDRDTGDLVYQVIDPGTRAVLVQTPHEAILKLRAYIARTERQHTERVNEAHVAEREQAEMTAVRDGFEPEEPGAR